MTANRAVLIACIVTLTVVQAKAADQTPKVVRSAPVTSIASGGGAQLSASNDGSEVAVKIAHELADIDNVRASFTTSALTMEAPISRNEKSQNLFTSDGFGNATRFGFSYTNFHTGVAPRAPDRDAAFDNYCAEMRAAAQSSPDRPAATDPKTLACDAENFSRYLKEKLPEVRSSLPLPRPGGVLWGVHATLGVQDDDHIDPDSFARTKTRHYPWSAGLYVGYNPPAMDSVFVLVKLDRKHIYQALDETVRCPALPTNAASVICRSGSFAPPTSRQGTSVGFEARYLIGPNLAMSFSVNRDTSTDRTAVELPVYLIASSAVALNGGVKIGWNSGDRRTVVGVFVGVPFSVWPF